MFQERHYYFSNTLRCHLCKFTIAKVQGPSYAAGLMPMWSCGLTRGRDSGRRATADLDAYLIRDGG